MNDHQAAACNFYVQAAEQAFATGVRAMHYGEAGSPSPVRAAAAQHTRQINRLRDGDVYHAARAALPSAYVAAFEALVLDNHPIGVIGATLFPGASRGQTSHNMREMVRTCADCLCLAFPRHSGAAATPRIKLLGAMQRMDAHITSSTAAASSTPSSKRPISDAISLDLLKADNAADVTLWLAPMVLAAIIRENGGTADLDSFGGVPVVVQEHWNWGWVIQRSRP